MAGAPARVDNLVSCTERVHVEAERSRVALADSFARLQALGAGEFGSVGIVQAYAHFVQTIDAAEQQTQRFGAAVDAMQAAAAPVFEQWVADTGTIKNERLRKRSEVRLAVSQERYDAIVAAAVPSREQFDSYVQELRDHATFLAHDLNTGALDELREEIRLVTESARNLDQELDRCLGAARSYVENAALPTAAPTR